MKTKILTLMILVTTLLLAACSQAEAPEEPVIIAQEPLVMPEYEEEVIGEAAPPNQPRLSRPSVPSPPRWITPSRTTASTRSRRE